MPEILALLTVTLSSISNKLDTQFEKFFVELLIVFRKYILR